MAGAFDTGATTDDDQSATADDKQATAVDGQPHNPQVQEKRRKVDGS